MNGHGCSSICVTLITLYSEFSNHINIIQANTENIKFTDFQILDYRLPHLVE